MQASETEAITSLLSLGTKSQPASPTQQPHQVRHARKRSLEPVTFKTDAGVAAKPRRTSALHAGPGNESRRTSISTVHSAPDSDSIHSSRTTSDTEEDSPRMKATEKRRSLPILQPRATLHPSLVAQRTSPFVAKKEATTSAPPPEKSIRRLTSDLIAEDGGRRSPSTSDVSQLPLSAQPLSVQARYSRKISCRHVAIAYSIFRCKEDTGEINPLAPAQRLKRRRDDLESALSASMITPAPLKKIPTLSRPPASASKATPRIDSALSAHNSMSMPASVLTPCVEPFPSVAAVLSSAPFAASLTVPPSAVPYFASAMTPSIAKPNRRHRSLGASAAPVPFAKALATPVMATPLAFLPSPLSTPMPPQQVQMMMHSMGLLQPHAQPPNLGLTFRLPQLPSFSPPTPNDFSMLNPFLPGLQLPMQLAPDVAVAI